MGIVSNLSFNIDRELDTPPPPQKKKEIRKCWNGIEKHRSIEHCALRWLKLPQLWNAHRVIIALDGRLNALSVPVHCRKMMKILGSFITSLSYHLAAVRKKDPWDVSKDLAWVTCLVWRKRIWVLYIYWNYMFCFEQKNQLFLTAYLFHWDSAHYTHTR